jgi:hypothetical protein
LGLESRSIDILEQRILRLEAIEAIKQLKARSLMYADCRDAEAFASLFAENGVLIGAYQEHHGRRAIEKNVDFWPFAVHYAMNPIIEVNGDSALGHWYFLRPQLDHNSKASWVAGWYEDSYSRIQGEWRFAAVRIVNCFNAPYSRGWVASDVVSVRLPS